MMRSPWTIVLHGAIALVLFGLGLFVLIENKMIISGKLSGNLYKLDYPNNILIAVSFFIVSAFTMLVLREGERIKTISQWLIIAALILFLLGAFL